MGADPILGVLPFRRRTNTVCKPMSVGVSNGTKTRSREAVGAGAMRGSQQHFTTDHLLTDLKGRTISSGFVTISAQAGKIVFMLSSTTRSEERRGGEKGG